MSIVGWLLMIAGFVIVSIFSPRDDTDSRSERSDMRLYTDHGTGCQYVKGGMFGGITPRLDKDGKPMCRESEVSK